MAPDELSDFDAPPHVEAARDYAQFVEDYGGDDYESHHVKASVSMWTAPDSDLPHLIGAGVLNPAIRSGAEIDFIDASGDRISVSFEWDRATADPDAITGDGGDTAGGGGGGGDADGDGGPDLGHPEMTVHHLPTEDPHGRPNDTEFRLEMHPEGYEMLVPFDRAAGARADGVTNLWNGEVKTGTKAAQVPAPAKLVQAAMHRARDDGHARLSEVTN